MPRSIRFSESTTRAYELSLAARTATNAEARQSIAIELEGLRDSIRDLANATDASGSAMFGGYKVDTLPPSSSNQMEARPMLVIGVHTQ